MAATIVAIAFAIAASTVSATTCYRPNHQAGNSDIQPCHADLSSGGNSACCNLGKSPPDLCLAGGLCYRQDGYDGNALIYAVGCTDITGVDSACQQYCPVSVGGPFMYALNACFDGRWCCDNLTNAESCCDPSTGAGSFTMNHLLSLDPAPTMFSAGNLPVTVTTTTMVSTLTSTSTSTSVGVGCSNNSSGSNTGVLVGASLGSAFGGFFVAAVGSVWLVRRLHTQREPAHFNHSDANMSYDHIARPNRASGWRHEMDVKREPQAVTTTSGHAYEIDSSDRAELR